jgi:hypothetical protein
MIAEAISHLQVHTGKLFTAWFLGTITWASSATGVVGFLGACVGLIAGLMLIVIRWEDFVNSKPITKLRAWYRGAK